MINLANKLISLPTQCCFSVLSLIKTFENKNIAMGQKSTNPLLLAKLHFGCSPSHLGFPFIMPDTVLVFIFYLQFLGAS